MTAERASTTEPIDTGALRPGALEAGAFRGRPVTVLGFARSGIALARFLVDAGADVTMYDGRPQADLSKAIEALEGRAVRLLLGPDMDPASALEGAALVASSPSINPDYPTTEPRLRSALQALVARRAGGDRAAPALVSEVDLFLRLCPAPRIGITGTKGKTTTSALTHALLATDERHPAVLGGNIGKPLVERLPELTPGHRVVVELSELQLPTLSRGTTVAAYTNVTADHLDRHGTLEAYRAVKRRLAELVDPAGALVLNLDDPIVAGYGAATGARAIPYRRGELPEGGLGLDHGWIVTDAIERLEIVGGGRTAAGRVMPAGELGVPGAHNISNAMAAIATALLFGIAPAAIRRAAAAFPGVEHRLERVAELDGVRFINDSQGTQPDAVIAALRAFDPPVVLIAGGRDKGVDLSELAGVVAKRAAAAVLIGESGADLERQFRAAGLRTIQRAGSMDEAVRAAYELAAAAGSGTRPGARLSATVLLSPAAASFDMFDDYEARGRAFKAEVARLIDERAGEGGA
ncbi:MAG TPA: UDP-N-acetylmuramoyl-L-alanine--D-glutamate ligase [Candidatus Limnocylindria bacterium]|nr:UDP-N-acetylmuramoyl-L-alanine--D-glutamate ligase [Candidatus Limnocylindria bacterium]